MTFLFNLNQTWSRRNWQLWFNYSHQPTTSSARTPVLQKPDFARFVKQSQPQPVPDLAM